MMKPELTFTMSLGAAGARSARVDRQKSVRRAIRSSLHRRIKQVTPRDSRAFDLHRSTRCPRQLQKQANVRWSSHARTVEVDSDCPQVRFEEVWRFNASWNGSIPSNAAHIRVRSLAPDWARFLEWTATSREVSSLTCLRVGDHALGGPHSGNRTLRAPADSAQLAVLRLIDPQPAPVLRLPSLRIDCDENRIELARCAATRTLGDPCHLWYWRQKPALRAPGAERTPAQCVTQFAIVAATSSARTESPGRATRRYRLGWPRSEVSSGGSSARGNGRLPGNQLSHTPIVALSPVGLL